MMHNIETIYRKLRSMARVIPGEYEMLFRDFDKRISAMEEKLNETRVEKSKPRGRKPSKVSETEVPTS
jgi:hypothetical protein